MILKDLIVHNFLLLHSFAVTSFGKYLSQIQYLKSKLVAQNLSIALIKVLI